MGTSTDVSRFDGHYEVMYEIQSPQLNINTVAAGNRSRPGPVSRSAVVLSLLVRKALGQNQVRDVIGSTSLAHYPDLD